MKMNLRKTAPFFSSVVFLLLFCSATVFSADVIIDEVDSSDATGRKSRTATTSSGFQADWASVVDRTSHRASSYDRSGGNDDNVMSFEPGQTHVLLDTAGPGKITHIWFTISAFPEHPFMLRDLVLRFYWENSPFPSVEVPLGDFFGLGHGKQYNVHSQPVNVGLNTRALNCYWPMPFYKHAKLEIFNKGTRSFRRIYFNIDYELGPIPSNQGLFHAEFRRVKNLLPHPFEGNTTGEDNYVILDAEGRGQYVGCFFFVDSAPGGWWGEGDEMMFVDGEKIPSIIGTGTEDYFCNAWGFSDIFNYPYYGVPFMEKQPDGWKQTTAYRFHLMDPVRFSKGLRVTMEHEWHGNKAYDFSSVAFWYQTKPNARRTPLPEGEEYAPRIHKGKVATAPKGKSQTIYATQCEPELRARGIAARAITTAHGKTLSGGFLQIDPRGTSTDIPLSLDVPGKYRLKVKFHALEQPSSISVAVQGKPDSKQTLAISQGKNRVDLGEVEVADGKTVVLNIESAAVYGIDAFLFELVK